MPVQLELPALYLDAVVFDDETVLDLINLDPEAGEAQVPVNAIIDLTIAADDAIVGAATTVSVNGVLAYDGGAFQPGFDGPGSTTTAIDAVTFRIFIDKTSNYQSLQVVEVSVHAETTGSKQLDESYAFTIEDLTAPFLISADAQDKKRIRIRFDENVVMESASGDNDALNPNNYAFEALESPSVSVEAVSVEEVDDQTVDITTDIELSFGREYRVTVTNVEDLFGNEIQAPTNALQFDAFTPQSPATRQFLVRKFIPGFNHRIDRTQDLSKILAVIQDVVDLLLCEVDRFGTILDPDDAPEEFLDAMLEDLGNPFAFDLSESDKRRLAKSLLNIYRLKGTAVGIISAVRFFTGIEITITVIQEEAWSLGDDELADSDGDLGDPPGILGGDQASLYTFEINTTVVLTDAQREQIEDIANYMKPGHTHLLGIAEPFVPAVPDHWELGVSELGETSLLH